MTFLQSYKDAFSWRWIFDILTQSYNILVYISPILTFGADKHHCPLFRSHQNIQGSFIIAFLLLSLFCIFMLGQVRLGVIMCKISTLKISSFIISDDEQNIKFVIAADLWSKKTLKFKNRFRENAIIIIIKYLRFEQMIKSGDQYINQLSLTPLHLFPH